MNIKIIFISIALFFTGALAYAESKHLPQAVEHTKAAIEKGESGNAAELTKHANTALMHATESEAAEKNEHTSEGITHLKAAIDAGNNNDAKGGTEHAKEALSHLEMAHKSMK